jgi:RNA polymerase sigma factor (sigma-70 family)
VGNEDFPTDHETYTSITSELLKEGLKKLNEEEIKVLELYYYEDKNQQEIGRIMGIKKERVHTIRQKALRQLRSSRKLRSSQWDY